MTQSPHREPAISDAAQLLTLAARVAGRGAPEPGDIRIARMAAAEVCRDDGWGDLAEAYLRGSFDGDDEILIALAALKLSRALKGANQ